jgi:hypothetical protein
MQRSCYASRGGRFRTGSPMRVKLAGITFGIVWASQAAAGSFNEFISFGDSSLDSGWWKGALQGQCDGATPTPCTTGSAMGQRTCSATRSYCRMKSFVPRSMSYARSCSSSGALAGGMREARPEPRCARWADLRTAELGKSYLTWVARPPPSIGPGPRKACVSRAFSRPPHAAAGSLPEKPRCPGHTRANSSIE